MRAFVSGSTGYIGSRLIPSLLAAGHEVVAGMRDPGRASDFSWGDQVQAVPFDIEDPVTVANAVAGADTAYFLVHSMARPGFQEKDAAGARNFAHACAAGGVPQIVYLSGLVPEGDLSEHLSSRLEVETIFLDAETPALVLRAAIILGAGSTSFELLRRLVERLPILLIPDWMDRLVQPVATEDVVSALVAAGGGAIQNTHVDLGGPDRLTYPELLALVADELDLRRPQVRLPPISHTVLGMAAAVITGIPRHTVIELVKSLRHDMVCAQGTPVSDKTTAREAIRRSLDAAHTGTLPHGDRQTLADSDPEWAGGEIERLRTGGLRSAGRSAAAEVSLVAGAVASAVLIVTVGILKRRKTR